MRSKKRIPTATYSLRRRGVSPIIATILLVAITVVIAAVLYVLVTGYLRGATPAPLNLQLQDLATGYNSKGTAHWLNFTAIANTKGLTTSVFGFKILAPSGAYVTGWVVSVIYNGNVLSTFAAGNSSWSSTVPVNGTDIVSFNTGPVSLIGTLDDIMAYGLGSTSVSGGYQGL